MKDIGIATLTGNYIVEMKKEEYHEFLRLENAITGKHFNDRLVGVDLSPVFKALSDLADTKHSIVVIQSYINNLAEYFGKTVIPQDENS